MSSSTSLVRNPQSAMSSVLLTYPPKTPSTVYELHFETLQEVLCDPNLDGFYILGDYNLPDVTWTRGTTDALHGSGVGSSVTFNLLCNLISFLDAAQYNYLVNTKNKILDLCISNRSCKLSAALSPLLPVDAYHPPFVCDIALNADIVPMKKQTLQRYNFYKSDYTHINRKIESTDWDEILTLLGSEEALSAFYGIIDEIIKQHTPFVGSRTSAFPVWFSKSLISTFRKKRKAWVKWKKYNNISDYEIFSQYRKLFKDMCNKCFSKYIGSVEDSIRKNIKDFWVYISNRRDKSGIPAKVEYNDDVSSDPQTICNMFSEFFSSVYEPPSPTLSQWRPPADLASHDTTITNLHFEVEKRCNANFALAFVRKRQRHYSLETKHSKRNHK
ncbi:unnamed protein product [Parnassius apollo]|uniref:(apollo) hypothetical protein n=1 Tax=Parnassius apollo TaxID=110799 RepID=A0A8S3WU90_PARAO|nr:unnamed protein product [Parnassius apollo]